MNDLIITTSKQDAERNMLQAYQRRFPKPLEQAFYKNSESGYRRRSSSNFVEEPIMDTRSFRLRNHDKESQYVSDWQIINNNDGGAY